MRILTIFCMFFFFTSCCNEEISSFNSHTVRIYLEDTHRNIPVSFETITEQVLLKEGYREGAFFETVTEQILSVEEHTIYNIANRTDLHLVTDTETYRIATLPCIDFYDVENFEVIEVPSTYVTRTWQKLIQDGTGDLKDPIYGTINYKRVDQDASLVLLNEDERAYEDFVFNINSEIHIDSFIQNQLAQQGITDCLQLGSYIILE